MLQIQESGSIYESLTQTLTTGGIGSPTDYTVPATTTGLSNCVQYWPYQTYWGSYPVYVCTDKTKKAIEILKALQAEKLIKCDSVPRFIALVEKISGLL